MDGKQTVVAAGLTHANPWLGKRIHLLGFSDVWGPQGFQAYEGGDAT